MDLGRISSRFRSCPDTEPEQAVIRVLLILSISLYLYLVGAYQGFTGWYFSLSCLVALLNSFLIILWIVLRSNALIARRVYSAVADSMFISLLMYFGEEKAIILFAVYIWVATGYGFRYGVGYLYLSITLSSLAFTAVILNSDYWGGVAYSFSLGVLFAILVIPLYATKLIGSLRAAMDRADAANAAKSQFLANMSHEMRTPLNGVMGFLNLMGKENLDNTLSAYVSYAERSARNLLGIINNVLDISKVEANAFELRDAPFKLKDMIHEVVSSLRPLADEKGLKLVNKIDPDLPEFVSGDRDRLGQIITNLLNNSIKFTLKGEVRFVTEVLRQGSDNNVRFIVEDTGIGISEEELSTIFEPFKQLDAGTERRYGGTGLGLSITKSIVEKMNGEISVVSETGEFTRTVVEIPLQTAAYNMEAANEVDLEISGFNGGGLTALVVDDNEINRVFLETKLNTCGFRTSVSASGIEALVLVQHGSFDIVLLDVHMSSMDGVETARRLRGMNLKMPPAIVAVTADVIGTQEGLLDMSDFDGFITKPVEEAVLVSVLEGLFPGVDRKISLRRTERISLMSGQKVLDVERGVELASGNRELWYRSLARLVESLPDQIKRMQDLVSIDDFQSIGKIAHSVQGSALYLGASRLACLAKELEGAVDECSAQKSEEMIRYFELEFNDLCNQFSSVPSPGKDCKTGMEKGFASS